MNREVYASKKSDHWATPKYIYDQTKTKGMYDPCPLHSKTDGLKTEWKKKNFVNPPYSQLRKWIEKAIEENRKGNEVILLIPARTDTKAYKTIFEYGAIIKFIIGRLRFNEADCAPFPSMLVKLTGKKTRCEIVDKNKIAL